MRYVIIDTSSILYGFSYNRNVFETARERFPGRKLLVSRGIVRELNAKASNKGEKGLRARIALLELKAKKINVDNISINADKWILNTALKNKGSIVITNDTALAESLVLAKAKVFKMSQSGILKLYR